MPIIYRIGFQGWLSLDRILWPAQLFAGLGWGDRDVMVPYCDPILAII